MIPTADQITKNESFISTLSLSNMIEYDEYILIMDEDGIISGLHQERKLSLLVSCNKIKSYLLMKTNFIFWFINHINDSQRKKFMEFIITNRDRLLHKQNRANCLSV
jgi:hypothetical protein